MSFWFGTMRSEKVGCLVCVAGISEVQILEVSLIWAMTSDIKEWLSIPILQIASLCTIVNGLVTAVAGQAFYD